MSFLDLAGLRLHYLERGPAAGPPVLLLHGFNQTAHSWDEIAERLDGDGFRAVALDQRGHGDSDRAPGGDYGREVMADDAIRLADALAIGDCTIIGMSMGAVHATLAAVRHPARVRGLVVVDWAPEVETRGVDALIRIATLAFPSFEAAVAAMHAFNPRRSLENLRARLGHSMAEGPDGQWRWKVDAAGFGAHPRFRDPPDAMWRALEHLACPLLLVRGAESNLLTAAIAERVVRTVRGAELRTVAGAGHSVAGDNPDGFYDAVGPFLSRVARARS